MSRTLWFGGSNRSCLPSGADGIAFDEISGLLSGISSVPPHAVNTDTVISKKISNATGLIFAQRFNLIASNLDAFVSKLIFFTSNNY